MLGSLFSLYGGVEERYPQLFNRKAPFVTSVAIGEFGNQLFEASAGISLALDNNAQYIHPIDSYEDVFTKFCTPVRKRVCSLFIRAKGIDECALPYAPISYKKNIRIKGFFQSYKFFDHHRDEIRDLFAPSPERVSYLKKKYPFLQTEQVVVGLHIRTYKKDQSTISLKEMYEEHVHCPNLPFIKAAIEYFDGDPLFVVCSDDIVWAKKALSSIDCRFYFAHDTLLNDFYLLTLCDHCIIGHSTFSWWAAYLNQNENATIIAPVPFKVKKHISDDIILPEWIQIPRTEDGMIPCFDGNTPFVKKQ